MVVRDLDFVRMAILPPEADPVLLVDANAVLSGPLPLEPFKPIAGRYPQVSETAHPVELVELTPDDRPERPGACGASASARHAVEEIARRAVRKGAYHETHYNGTRSSFQSRLRRSAEGKVVFPRILDPY